MKGAFIPSLQVRKLPEHLYQKLKETAVAKHRCLAQQAIIALARGLETELDPKMRRKMILKNIAQEQPIGMAEKLSDPAKLIDGDRKR